MLDPGSFGRIGGVLTLSDLTLFPHAREPEVLHPKRAISALHSALQGSAVVVIGLDQLGPGGRQRLGSRLVRVAGQRADFPTLGEQVPGDRPALLPAGTGNSNDLILVLLICTHQLSPFQNMRSFH